MRRQAQLGVCRIAAAAFAILLWTSSAWAQLNQNCTVSVLNRTVQVNADGSWVLPNVPANFGKVKARAVCVQNGVTTFGESDFFLVDANKASNLPAITPGATTPIPVSLAIGPNSPSLTSAGQTVQLAVTATDPDGSSKDVTSNASGTNYTISNPAIATISADGLVTAVSSGTVVIQANNDGATGIISVSVTTGPLTVSGLPLDWVTKHGLNPADPLLALEDPDRDGLTNLQENQLGTDPNNPDSDGDGLTDGDEVNKYGTKPTLADTDGDGIPDGVEVQTGTDPLNRNSYDLKKATATSTVSPASFTLSISNSSLTPTVQLQWKVTLIDGKTSLDLLADARTNLSSSDLAICRLESKPGLITALKQGSCAVTLSQNTLSATVPGTITSFTPTELSTLIVPGAVAVDVGGNFAYVATGVNGLSIVDVTDRAKPYVRSTLPQLGDAEGIRTSGNYVYIADATGFLRVIDVQDPDAPALTGSLAINGTPSALSVHGNIAIVVSKTPTIYVVNIADPAKPGLLSTAVMPGPAYGVDFDLPTGLAAFALSGKGLQLVDISNAASPKLRGLLPGGTFNACCLDYRQRSLQIRRAA